MEKPERLFEKFLSERNVPMSETHKAVCDVVFDIHDHLTLDQLCGRLNEISRSDVKEVLTQLVYAGLVRKVIFREDQVFYEHIYGHIHHDHLLCIGCGKIVEFTHPGIEINQEEVSKTHGFEMLRHSLRIEGLCGECRAKADATQIAPVPQQPRRSEMPLSMVGNGERVLIEVIRGGRKIQQKLSSMGINQGDEVEVLQNTFTGPITIRSRDSRIAIGHGMSHKIFVKPVS